MPQSFKNRHIGPSSIELNEMLKVCGYETIDDLINETIPKPIQASFKKPVSEPLTEYDFLKYINDVGKKNKQFKSFIGYGYYDTITPSVIQRCILENPGWYTQYTPYQPEISQGRLEALINFQTMVTELTKLPIANASLLDEGTAAAEAMIMSYRCRKNKEATTYYISKNCFPQTIAVVQTRAHHMGINVDFLEDYDHLPTDAFGICIQYPDKYGEIHDNTSIIKEAQENNSLITFCADILALSILKSPGELGADICVGSTQRFGIPMGFGGPHAAYFACKDSFSRKIPGRIIGATIDRHGNKALRMALQTREQHIRKEKATSNICTAQALLAIMAGFYSLYHGPKGLIQIASDIVKKSAYLHKKLTSLSIHIKNKSFFDTVTLVEIPIEKREKIQSLCKDKQININIIEDDCIILSCDETTSFEDIDTLVTCFNAVMPVNQSTSKTIKPIPDSLQRTDQFMTQQIFHDYHSETNMMRYIRHLENKDYSLCTGMIPLGSCTMKLNAATEMIPISDPNFSSLHPFSPPNQTLGYQQIINELGEMLCTITDMDGVSFQPNSGAQGEYAGLLSIKAYFDSINESQRNIALVPTSAHGTNPASAIMAGLDVIPVQLNENGTIDIEDCRKKAERYKETLAVLMITFPSTNGVFDENVQEITTLIHDNGGQVYMDGANLNAHVGLTNPAIIGADVCHINLHKTFSIPHGGGGPGMGPICVKSHLKPFLPTFSLHGSGSTLTVAAAPYSSANILLISYAYIKLLGSVGITESTKVAILNANYIKQKLDKYFPTLFKGVHGNVAHECIIDFRTYKKEINIDVEDIAKRLIDYSFHAPTMSWPVPGTLMIEPTESESKKELDRFCDTLIQIFHELEDCIQSKNNQLYKNSPHTIQEVTSSNWDHAYSREAAAFPTKKLYTKKFWPTIGRVNQALGDRQLICTCEAWISDEENHLLKSNQLSMMK